MSLWLIIGGLGLYWMIRTKSFSPEDSFGQGNPAVVGFPSSLNTAQFSPNKTYVPAASPAWKDIMGDGSRLFKAFPTFQSLFANHVGDLYDEDNMLIDPDYSQNRQTFPPEMKPVKDVNVTSVDEKTDLMDLMSLMR